ncbi:CoA transferase [Streptomyces sp. t39]|uniref:CoA transferase n=1 Tax=Streptomyces sp. t39 TaxID=1828156 RepID=UPI0011CD9133|nr:CoA transferase [Streptomyces sp. t39]TXS51125.1 hypothetical protein EAO77_24795 [Streptomyces sp. t39]
MTHTSPGAPRDPADPASGTAGAWAALGGDPALLDRVTFTGAGALPSRLPVEELARSTVAVCSLAAAELAALRDGGGVPAVRVDDGAVTTAFLGDRLVRVDGVAPTTFAPLSRFWRTADGWVRTHANYPHHRGRLLAALGLPKDTDTLPDGGVADVAATLGGRRARDVEETVCTAGGLAVAVRTAEEWAAHPQGAAVAGRPLLVTDRIGGEGPRRAPGGPGLPCAGLRVLDLTRVLAGPVASRTLALLGADVLRIDSPGLPESQEAHDDTGLGKRSALLDLARRADRAAFEELLASADVVLTGYRPGALDRFGLTPQALAGRRPGLVVARLSAWGRHGPWAGRRGFDSLVQAASGIALEEGDATSPGALPAQALDHGTGYLLAAGVLRSLTDQHTAGGARLVEVALAQTAAWLTQGLPAGPPAGTGAYTPGPWLTERATPRGSLRHALPAVAYVGGPADWASPSGLLGADAPAWRA